VGVDDRIFVDGTFHALPFMVGDRLRLRKRLGRGGMAEVFLAELRGSRSFSRTVVAKRLRPDFAARPKALDMFEREAAVLAQLNHPNIVAVVDFVDMMGEPWLLLEHVDGPTLRKLLRANGPIPLPIARRILGDTARALAAVHEAVDDDGRPMGLVHRDVSPDNIMLTAQGQAKLLDFGIAKGQHHASLTTVGALKGKLAYMAPEQLHLEACDAAVDLYALGVTAFEILAGRRPFESKSDVLLMDMVINDEPPELASMVTLPAAMTLLVHWLLEKERQHRPPSAAAVAELFDRRAHELVPMQDLMDRHGLVQRRAAAVPRMTSSVSSEMSSSALSTPSLRAQSPISDSDDASVFDDEAEATIRGARERIAEDKSRMASRPRLATASRTGTARSDDNGSDAAKAEPGWWSLVGSLVDDDVVEIEEGSQVVRRLPLTPEPVVSTRVADVTVTVQGPVPKAPTGTPAVARRAPPAEPAPRSTPSVPPSGAMGSARTGQRKGAVGLLVGLALGGGVVGTLAYAIRDADDGVLVSDVDAPGDILVAPGDVLVAPGDVLVAPGDVLVAPGDVLVAPGDDNSAALSAVTSPPDEMAPPPPAPEAPPPTPAPAPAPAPAPPPATATTTTPAGEARPPRPPRKQGRLSVLAVPWAEVFVDGKRLGVTPIDDVRVDAGKHRLRLVGPQGEVNRDITVTSGKLKKVRVAMPE